MQDAEFAEVVNLILKEDPRYDRRAYAFVRDGLDHTIKELRKHEAARASAHVSAAELLGGLRAYAIEQFGPLAHTVLNSWGVYACGDFGSIVFNLIDYNVLSKNADDRREDFAAGYDFDEAFITPFLPRKTRKPPPAEEKPEE